MNMQKSPTNIKPHNETRVSRRSIFAAIPALALTATAASAYQPKPPVHEPIPEWFEEWKTLRAAVDLHGEDFDTHAERLHELEYSICTAKPKTREGAIAQLEYAMDDFGDYMFGNIWKDHDTQLFNNLLGALKAGVA